MTSDPLVGDLRDGAGVSLADPSQPSVESVWSLLEFETLISDTSASLFAAPPDKIGLAVERAMEKVRLFFEVERSAILAVSASESAVHILLASYADGIPDVPTDVNLVPAFPWSFRTLFVERKPVRISRRIDLPPDEHTERESWIQLPIQAALTFPIETGGIVTHAILLNSLHRECEWPDAFVTRLRVLGEMLIGALERQALISGLSEAEERLNLAADSAEAGLWALDMLTGICWATERARTMFGYSPDEVITVKRLDDSIHPDDREHVRRAMKQSGVERKPFDVDYRILLPDGSVRWVASRGRPHLNSAGELDRMMASPLTSPGASWPRRRCT